MKYLLLIRHCETRELAGYEPAQHRSDSPLSARGVQQAEQLATHLHRQPIELILCSLFLRAQTTAAVLNRERGVPVLAAMQLNEYQLRDDGSDVESTQQGQARAMTYLYQFSPYYEYIAVVAHSSILATILMTMLNLPYNKGKDIFERPGTCCTLRYDHHRGDQHWRRLGMFIPQ